MFLKKILGGIKKDESGLTLTEVLTASTLFVILIGGFWSLYFYGWNSWRMASESTQAQQNARLSTQRLVKELREAQDPSDILEPIPLADDTELTFYADVNSNSGPERVHYFVDSNQQLIKGVLNPGNNQFPWVYSGTESREVVAKYFQNGAQPLFRYFDSDGNELSSVPLSQADRAKVKLIKITPQLDVDLVKVPGQFEMETEVKLRNL